MLFHCFSCEFELFTLFGLHSYQNYHKYFYSDVCFDKRSFKSRQQKQDFVGGNKALIFGFILRGSFVLKVVGFVVKASFILLRMLPAFLRMERKLGTNYISVPDQQLILPLSQALGP